MSSATAVQQAPLPASPVGRPYSGRVIDADLIVAPDMSMGWLVTMTVRTPRPYRGKSLAFLVKLDPDRPETFEQAALTLHRMGITPAEQWKGDVAALLKGRTLSFAYSPAQRNAAGGTEDERIEIVGCVYAPNRKEK